VVILFICSAEVLRFSDLERPYPRSLKNADQQLRQLDHDGIVQRISIIKCREGGVSPDGWGQSYVRLLMRCSSGRSVPHVIKCSKCGASVLKGQG